MGERKRAGVIVPLHGCSCPSIIAQRFIHRGEVKTDAPLPCQSPPSAAHVTMDRARNLIVTVSNQEAQLVPLQYYSSKYFRVYSVLMKK